MESSEYLQLAPRTAGVRRPRPPCASPSPLRVSSPALISVARWLSHTRPGLTADWKTQVRESLEVNWTLMVERLRETNGLRWTQTWWWRDRSMAYRPAAVLLGPALSLCLLGPAGVHGADPVPTTSNRGLVGEQPSTHARSKRKE